MGKAPNPSEAALMRLIKKIEAKGRDFECPACKNTLFQSRTVIVSGDIAGENTDSSFLEVRCTDCGLTMMFDYDSVMR